MERLAQMHTCCVYNPSELKLVSWSHLRPPVSWQPFPPLFGHFLIFLHDAAMPKNELVRSSCSSYTSQYHHYIHFPQRITVWSIWSPLMNHFYHHLHPYASSFEVRSIQLFFDESLATTRVFPNAGTEATSQQGPQQSGHPGFFFFMAAPTEKVFWSYFKYWFIYLHIICLSNNNLFLLNISYQIINLPKEQESCVSKKCPTYFKPQKHQRCFFLTFKFANCR